MVTSPVVASPPVAPADTVHADAAAEQESFTGREENLYLIGRPPLKKLFNYVRRHAVKPMSEAELTDAWNAANRVIRQLEHDEAGLADDPPIEELGPDYEPLLIEFLKDPLVRHGFNTVPTEVAMVELDRLVVYQKHIDVTFARRLEARLGPAPSPETIFRTCLPYDHPQPPVRWSRVRDGKFVFVSPSNDLRYLGTLPLEPDDLHDYAPPGAVVGIVGLAVGFGSNFLNAVFAERRLILNNGSHRAYALRRMGVTHVPCIVQHVSSRAELEAVGPSKVRHDPDHYLRHPRPSMLKDYFDPRLHLTMEVHRRLRQITVTFKVEEDYVPGL